MFFHLITICCINQCGSWIVWNSENVFKLILHPKSSQTLNSNIQPDFLVNTCLHQTTAFQNFQ